MKSGLEMGWKKLLAGISSLESELELMEWKIKKLFAFLALLKNILLFSDYSRPDAKLRHIEERKTTIFFWILNDKIKRCFFIIFAFIFPINFYSISID